MCRRPCDHYQYVHCMNKYIGPLYCRAEMYADRVACVLPLVSHGEYADGTDGQTDIRTPDRYIMLHVRGGQRNKSSRK